MTRLALVAAFALMAGSALAQSPAPPYPPAPEQQNCTVWTAKLATGIDVIGAPPSAIAQARNSLAAAQNQQQAGKWYACATAAKAGLDALKAG